MATTSDRPPLALAVRTARERSHLTQAELAKRVGVSRAAIAELEAGRIQQPRAAVFARLSAVLGIPVAILLAATGVGDVETAALAELEGDDLVAMAAGMVRMADQDRRWLRDRFAELRELLVLRRSGRPRGKKRR
ncbi:MAG: helix-turn-helix transcriptional regulator [Chloroflexi bacterium]|nr:MAG: helix-turn-helix transcriptional regulator [Chloroflexota bacterium]